MKWMEARSDKICTSCNVLIKEKEKYFGGSYQTFCKECGIKYKNGELRYSSKDKSYIDIATNKECSICGDLAENSIHGRVVCDEHIGSVIDEAI
jgi:hypothetical protein